MCSHVKITGAPLHYAVLVHLHHAIIFLCHTHTAVSGAHNTIVTARAGKDLISSLVSGLLTIVSLTKQ